MDAREYPSSHFDACLHVTVGTRTPKTHQRCLLPRIYFSSDPRRYEARAQHMCAQRVRLEPPTDGITSLWRDIKHCVFSNCTQ